MTGKISVLMAAYNAAGYIAEAIASVQQQTNRNWELLVIDDVSTDNTAAVVQRMAMVDPRIRLIKSEKNGGPGAARNLGLATATGEWVTVLDCDDKYMPNRLERLLAFAQDHDLDLVADNHFLFNLNTNQIFAQGFYAKADAYPLTAEMLVRNDCLGQWFPFGLLKPFIRRSLLQANNLTYPDIRLGEDFCLFYSLLLRCQNRAALLCEPLYVYTPQVVSDRSKTSLKAEAWDEYRQTCRQRLTNEAQQYARGDAGLEDAIIKRDHRLSQYIVWSHTRDPSRPMASVRKWMVFFNPYLWPLVLIAIRRKLISKHGIPFVPAKSFT